MTAGSPPEQARSIAERWLQAEPDDDVRTELQALLDGPADELGARFAGSLMFGTAGLRAAIGAGPLRMNRLVVRQAARGLADYVLELDDAARERGVVIGYDARRKSDVFALDSARVMAAAGLPVRLLPVPLPTPLLAWGVTELRCAAGVMVTASHNPPADNGYKVYLGDGAQIVPPHDLAIAERIAAVDPTTVPLADAHDARIARVPHAFIDAYVDTMRTVRMRPAWSGVPVAYTPLHGVGGEVTLRAFEAAGLPEPYVVPEQFEPDPAFPTVSFPNPEEPGAMDLVIALAQRHGVLLAIANDPDADRLGAAIPQPDGTWRRLGGDEIGWLLADHLLTNSAPGPHGEDRLVVTTLVSSSLLATMAADYGVHFAETFTGFKWMARAALDRPQLRLLFAYEQALGYLVTSRPLDKDGISAAVVLAEIAAVALEEGTTIQGRLDDIAARYGRHVVGERALRMPPAQGAAAVRALQDAPPTTILDVRVADVRSYPEADLLRLVLEGGVRLQVRPSGTEPKVKLYGEAVDADPAPYLDALAALLQPPA
ncbi:MAG TPA: phospho-sugar mutase [Ilumatobacteraceae bacterium]|nr:phospho-sugar mutase [Ilumatobacteraceae bacterium]